MNNQTTFHLKMILIQMSKKTRPPKEATIANVFTNHSSKKSETNSMNISFSVKNNKISRKTKLIVKV